MRVESGKMKQEKTGGERWENFSNIQRTNADKQNTFRYVQTNVSGRKHGSFSFTFMPH
jgi:hypothetical protein